MASRGQWMMVGGILLGIGGALFAMHAVSPDVDLVEPGVAAPNFAARDLATGDTVTLASDRGKVVLVNIWATWCAPCQEEMPSIQALHDSLGPDGLKILAVSVDKAGDKTVRDWVAERHLTFDILHDPSGKIAQVYQTTGYPESFIIDRHGVIVKKVWGATQWNDASTIALFRRLLAER